MIVVDKTFKTLGRHVQGYVPGGSSLYAQMCEGPCAIYYLGRHAQGYLGGLPLYAVATQGCEYPFGSTVGFSGGADFPPGISNIILVTLHDPACSGINCCQGFLTWDGSSKWTGTVCGVSLEVRVSAGTLYVKVVGGCTPTTEVAAVIVCPFPLQAQAAISGLTCCPASTGHDLLQVDLIGYCRRNKSARHLQNYVPGSPTPLPLYGYSDCPGTPLPQPKCCGWTAATAPTLTGTFSNGTGTCTSLNGFSFPVPFDQVILPAGDLEWDTGSPPSVGLPCAGGTCTVEVTVECIASDGHLTLNIVGMGCTISASATTTSITCCGTVGIKFTGVTIGSGCCSGTADLTFTW